MKRGGCALAVTVRDEARLLSAHLEYHRLLGIEQAYVYLDEPGDATRTSIEHLDWVTPARCIARERFRGTPGLEHFVASWDSHLEARQSLNVVDAMAKAEAAGCEWLLSIDADELVCLDRRGMRPGSLPRALAELPKAVTAAWLPNLEVVPRPRSPRLVFREARWFKRPGGPTRAIRDPRDDRLVCEIWLLGHSAGKSLVRLGRGAVPSTSHRFSTPEGRALPTATLGEILHYHAYDFQDWYRRYHNYHRHAPRHVSGLAVEPQKLLWTAIVETLDTDLLEAYYARTCVPDRDELERLKSRSWRSLFRRPYVVEVGSVAEAFEREPVLQRY